MDEKLLTFNMPASQEVDSSIEILLSHCKNKKRFKRNPYTISIGGIDSSDYTNKSMRRSKFNGKQFPETKFLNSASAGSLFANCKFLNCTFKNANFQECMFLTSTIENNLKENSIEHCNFNQSLFSDQFEIKDVLFEHSVFQGTAFIDGLIKDTTFFSSTLVDALFSKVTMESVLFNDLNIDYATFENVTLNDVVLPFSQICFTFNLLSYLSQTEDAVYITSVQKESGYMNKQEFLSLLPVFETYYMGTEDYFPLANIYLSTGRMEEAKNAILSGILSAAKICDFRQIKYLCKLIYSYSVFDFHTRKSIWDYINSQISFSNMHASFQYNYLVYKNEIESYLLLNNHKNVITAEIEIQTNIFHDNAKDLGILISVLERIIENNKSTVGSHQIYCRHNSAEALMVLIQELSEALYKIIPAIYSVLIGVFLLDEHFDKRKMRKLELRHAEELKDLEIAKQQTSLEHEQLLLEKEKEEKLMRLAKQQEQENEIRNKILRGEIIDNNVEVTMVSHIIYGNLPPDFDKNLIQYSSRNN